MGLAGDLLRKGSAIIVGPMLPAITASILYDLEQCQKRVELDMFGNPASATPPETSCASIRG